MTKKMLIDASHPEETRVAILDGRKLEDLDFESLTMKQVKSNIYLAKVTRVEPSLQACFVEYGGNRHGFLPFSEIHPDYFRIPIEDREALIAEEAEADNDDNDDDLDLLDSSDDTQHQTEEGEEAERENVDEAQPEHVAEHLDTAADAESFVGGEGEAVHVAADEILEPEQEGEQPALERTANRPLRRDTSNDDDDDFERPRRQQKRRYKIQEVIKKRQILLIQVNKEERGNKGAALTTYLSIAGRYCILMPNNPRGGGISRKISDAKDRRRIRKILQELEIPTGVSVIVRTAGMGRTKAEIKRDYEYLLRLWDDLRQKTLGATAPELIYEEGNLIKRALRDNYQRDIDTIIIEGEKGYTEAKNFMKMLMPSHVKRIQQYKDPIPLFQAERVEAEIDAILSPTVQLPSGGYLVINQTEALVSIDVNSGRAIRERNIEETALKTNLEAADEAARQIRLRDLAGLIVIDFIDMVSNRNNAAVEKRMRDALKTDRARVQVGRISMFGLLEMSRQRLRPSLTEISTLLCPSCGGTGRIRSPETIALHVLRSLQDEGVKKPGKLQVRLPAAVAMYIFNQKRHVLAALEERNEITVSFVEDTHVPQVGFVIDRLKQTEIEEGDEDGDEKPAANRHSADSEDGADSRRRSRGGRGRGRGREDGGFEPQDTASDAPVFSDDAADTEGETDDTRDAGNDNQPSEPRGEGRERGVRGRRRRGGRSRGGRNREEGVSDAAAEPRADHDAAPFAHDDEQPANSDSEAQPPHARFERPERSERGGRDRGRGGRDRGERGDRAPRPERSDFFREQPAQLDTTPREPAFEIIKTFSDESAPRAVAPKVEVGVVHEITGKPDSGKKGWWSRIVK